MTMMSRMSTTTGTNKEKMQNRQLIVGVEPHSIAHKLRIKKGDHLLTVNGEPVRDVFDYRFLAADEYVELKIEKANGKIRFFEIEKEYGEDLGLVFGQDLMDNYRSCTNKCIFCFIDQMPGGMRETLYFKDDDSRLSFLQGNYITLTNMKEEDIRRIIRYHMAPINISVHTTDPDLRCKMLNNRFAGEVLRYLDLLYDAEIPMNGQIVLCRGINDGDHLKKTISDLSEYIPCMKSLSVVPAGLTKYRDGLFPLEKFTKNDALEVIKTVENFQQTIYNKFSTHFVHASDEFYLLAGLEVPGEESYDGYLQLENGVGMLRLLEVEFHEALSLLKESPELQNLRKRRLSVATGLLAYPSLKRYAEEASKLLGLEISVYGIRNNFFGDSITVSGLLCGQDLISQLKGKELGEELLLPVNMFRAGEEYFLDDITKQQVEQALHVKVVIVPSDGAELVNAFCGKPPAGYRRQIYEQAHRGDRGEA